MSESTQYGDMTTRYTETFQQGVAPLRLEPRYFYGTSILFGVGPYFPERIYLYDGKRQLPGPQKIICIDDETILEQIIDTTGIYLKPHDKGTIPQTRGAYQHGGSIEDYLRALRENKAQEQIDIVAGFRLPHSVSKFLGPDGILDELGYVLKNNGMFVLTSSFDGDRDMECLQPKYLEGKRFRLAELTELSNPSPAGFLDYTFSGKHVGVKLVKNK